MAHKTHDIVAKVGEYTDRQGQTKARYENVGALMQGDNGPFILLDRHFNPAGINGKDGKIVVSCFEPKERDQGNPRRDDRGASRPKPQESRRSSRDDDLDDDVPF